MGAAFFAAWWVAYDYTNTRGANPVYAIKFVRPTDQIDGIVLPWTALIYVTAGFVLPVMPFVCRRCGPNLWFVLVSYTITSAVALGVYLVWPVCIDCSSYDGPGLGRWVMREVVAVDKPANCFPSSRVHFAALGALFVGRPRVGRLARFGAWVAATGVAVSTVTTGQHYFIDVIGGTVVALFGYALARRSVCGAGLRAPVEDR